MKTIFLSIFILLLSIISVFGQTVSIESLLKEMVDREEKARFPLPEFTCKQFSSYDRSSVARNEPGWFANWDRNQFVAIEEFNGKTEYVMMDAEGPGAIVRFWMTFSGPNCGRGTMRIYIDDMTIPAIEGKAFDILSGSLVSEYPLAASVSKLTPYENRGHNLYYPIPYAKRCKVTYESDEVRGDIGGKGEGGNECVYYNINYRTYAPEIEVLSYSVKQVAKNKPLAKKVIAQLKAKDRGLKGSKLARTVMDAEFAPAESRSFHISGQNAIRHIGMRIESRNKEQALRSIVLQISFDGKRTVWIPIGDFFGIGPRQIYTSTWYTSATPEGKMDAWWVMPFEKECEITLTNYGSEIIEITDAVIETTPWKWDLRSMHFGSAWHQYSSIYTGGLKTMNGTEDGPRDLNFVTILGKGVYIGDGIALFNTTYGWWGEGDEKIFVDGEDFPSHFGTGTEDYYGYAWCRPEKFTDHPFVAQPLGDGSFTPAYTANTRVRALDGIPFNKSIEMDMELWHWSKGNIDYAASTFWYAIPGTKANIEPDIDGVQHKVAMKRGDIMPEKVMLSLEGEHMGLVSKDHGWFEYRYRYPEKLSRGMQMYWWGNQPGSKLTMEFDSDWELTGNISALCSVNKEGAIVNIYLNGELLAKDINLYSDKSDVCEFELGVGSLKDGVNRFVFEAVKPGDLGIDMFIFKK